MQGTASRGDGSRCTDAAVGASSSVGNHGDDHGTEHEGLRLASRRLLVRES